jgi:predicted nucleic acid-binding protein
MAEGKEIETARALVLDANIMIRGVFGTRVRTLIERYANEVALFTPQTCVDEVREYIPPLCAKRGWDPAVALETLDALLTGIEIVESASLAELESDARRRIAARDPDDWPALALAMAINAPVWTEDPDFFGAGVATWTTRNVEIYLSTQ